MKRWIPWIVAAVLAGWLGGSLRQPRDTGIAVEAFGRLPVVFNGRLQPFDSLARNSLLQMREKQSIRDAGSKTSLGATAWLMEVMFKPQAADERRSFRIDNPDLKGLFGLTAEPPPGGAEDGKHYAWSQLAPKLRELEEQARNARRRDASQRTAFEQATLRLYDAMTLYLRLQNTVQPMDSAGLVAELEEYAAGIPSGVAAFKARMSGAGFDTNALTDTLVHAERFLAMRRLEPPLVVPPAAPRAANEGWRRMGDALLDAALPAPLLLHLMGQEPLAETEAARLVANAGQEAIAPPALALARMSDAFREGRTEDFNRELAAYRATLEGPFAAQLAKVAREDAFNHFQPFYKALVLDVLAFLLACAFWATLSDTTRRTGSAILWVALIVHSAGIIARMWIEGRPPVTNLYSSAIFIGWGAVVLGLILESFWRNAIGLAVASVIGFASLIVAHHLSLGGDTLEMMRAVLDTNFWLATHVVVVTLGYAATYVAGFLAILYVVLGLFTRVVDAAMARALTRAVYGIVCFATLFSFVGTVLGGIWADQSWGRFWGWDPKENGALIIVLWNALILHARWGGLVRERGLHVLSIGGNIVTTWSWFGTNMLGIGLHSYGFTDAAFRWLMILIFSQLALIGLGLLPTRLWRSFQGGNPDTDASKGARRSSRPRPATA